MNRDPNLLITMSEEVTTGGGPVSCTVSFPPEEHPASSRIDHEGHAGALRKLVIPFRTRRNGPGLTNEALIEIVAMRLQGFQGGPSACGENATALAHLHTAHEALIRRADKITEGEA